MKFAFRVDASVVIGNGHVLRCLTLAKVLQKKGHQCLFICRMHEGYLGDKIAEEGFEVLRLPIRNLIKKSETQALKHWLGASIQDDVTEIGECIKERAIDWVIVDHYAIDHHWEAALKNQPIKIMVIDDLADRYHKCDLLLDQNLGRSFQDYAGRVPQNCKLLLGVKFALLRNEFTQMRPVSLARRKNFGLNNILVTLGGVDSQNISIRILNLLELILSNSDCKVNIILGSNAPWINSVIHFISKAKVSTSLLLDVKNMATLMSHSDLIIGAAGTTAWERCCLGIPSISIALAKNQINIQKALIENGVILPVEVDDLDRQLINAINKLRAHPDQALAMGLRGSKLVDGLGVNRVVDHVLELD